jgi:hypothetical protein
MTGARFPGAPAQAMDIEAPQVARDLPTPPVDADPRRVHLDLLRWARRWHLHRWAVEYAHDRIWRQRKDLKLEPEWKGWLPLDGSPVAIVPMLRSQVQEPRAVQLRRLKGYARAQREFVKASSVNLLPEADVRRLVRRQVLGESPERIATVELAGRYASDQIKRRRALRSRSQVVRDAVMSAASRIGLRVRRLRAGRPRKQGIPR